jgi:hypothetical protein
MGGREIGAVAHRKGVIGGGAASFRRRSREGMATVMASRASPRHGGSVGPAHKDGGCMRRLGTGSAAETEVEHGGGGLSCRKMGGGRGASDKWRQRRLMVGHSASWFTGSKRCGSGSHGFGLLDKKDFGNWFKFSYQRRMEIKLKEIARGLQKT